ncbi:MAG: LPS export ABC transporter ATP-binding protein [Candidatus Schekmanbacteria bacterium]|nr:MAG: LPS export ABC transporter ATP-binding protein [Candidatus Schekmanbacteria bacterium]
MNKSLKIVSVSKTYGNRRVVDNVSMEVFDGEVVGLLGPNGAGKTTTFYMVVGMITPESGEIILNNENIVNLPMYMRARKGIAYLPQESSVFRKLTVEENFKAILEMQNISQKNGKKRLKELLEELGLTHLAKNKAYTLSGGERRRLEITRTLITNPDFILLDEPFAGIEPKAVDEIQQIINLLKNRGIGIIITDHNVRETLKITDRAYIISEGKVIEHGTPETIAKNENVRKVYLGNNFELLN